MFKFLEKTFKKTLCKLEVPLYSFYSGHPKTVSSQCIENTFLDYPPLQMHSISCAIQFVSVRSSWGNLSLFEISGASVYYCPENYRCNFINFFLNPLSITTLNLNFLGFLFPTINSLALGVKCEKLNFRKSYGILLNKVSKFINGTIMPTNFCCPQVI